LLDRCALAVATLLHSEVINVALSMDADIVQGRLLPCGSDAAVLVDQGETICRIDGEPADAWHPINVFIADRREAIVESASRLTSDPLVLTGRWASLGSSDEGQFLPYTVTTLSGDGPKATLIDEGWFAWDQPRGLGMLSCPVDGDGKQDVLPYLEGVTNRAVMAANEALYGGELVISGVLWQIDTCSYGRVIVATYETPQEMDRS